MNIDIFYGIISEFGSDFPDFLWRSPVFFGRVVSNYGDRNLSDFNHIIQLEIQKALGWIFISVLFIWCHTIFECFKTSEQTLTCTFGTSYTC